MTNTKICPQCGEVSPVQAASCPRCGRQFKTTAPLNNQQNDPKTVIGSFSPSFGQQNQSQSSSKQQQNFGQQGGYNQQASFQNEQASYQPAFGQLPNNNQQNFNPSFNQPSFSQQPTFSQPPSSSKAVWWILGGVLSLVMVGFIGLVLLGVLAAAADQNRSSSTTSSTSLANAIQGKWQSLTTNAINDYGSNARFSVTKPDGTTIYGDYGVTGDVLEFKPDSLSQWYNVKITISGNTMTFYAKNAAPSNYRRIE